MTQHDLDIVTEISQRLRTALGEEDFFLWFDGKVRWIFNEDKTALTLETKTRFVCEWIQQKYRKRLLGIVEELSGKRPTLTCCENPEAFADVAEERVTGHIPELVSSVQESRVVSAEKERLARRERSARRRSANKLPEAHVKPRSNGALHQAVEQVMERANGSSNGLPNGLPGGLPNGKGRRSGKRLNCGTFESFVKGSSNALAYNALQMVLEDPGFIPLVVVFGTPGVGKTHLLEAVRHEALQRGSHVEMTTAETFVVDFVRAVRTSPEMGEAFRERFRTPDILILDDIQYLLGKKASSIEFMHILSELQQKGRQVILACDRPLEELRDFGKEIYSRLSCASWCPLRTPSSDVRLRLVDQLAEERGLTLSATQRKQLASRFTSDVREIVGALNMLRVMSRSDQTLSLWHESANGTSATQQSMDEMFFTVASHSARPVQIDEIRRVVCEVFGLSQEALLSGGRTQRVSQPRMLAMWLARKYTDKSLTEIGKFFGCTSHSTVISAQRKVDGWLEKEVPLQTSRNRAGTSEVLLQIESRLQYVSGN